MPENNDNQGDTVEKPCTDIKRARHDTDAKRHGIHGKTARKVGSGWTPFPARAELSKMNDNRWCMRPHERKRLLWTALELEGRDSQHSLDRDLAWEHVPKLLHDNAVRPPLIKKKADGTVETTYQLEPLVEEVVNSAADEEVIDPRRRPAFSWTDGKLYTLRNGKRPTLWAVPPTAPPEEITLRTKLITPVRMGDGRNTRCFPLVRRTGTTAWDVTQHGGIGTAKLDIDLGADCLITHVSTQGRQPPTRVYPEVRRERRQLKADLLGLRHSAGLGRRAQRTLAAERREADVDAGASADLYWVEGRRWDLLKLGQYPGPYWDVLNLRGDEERCKRTGRPYLPHERWLQWVSKYEIRYRLDGGRQWHLLGLYKGNDDATSEVAHDVRGLRARYLRIVPLEAVGMGAMRVGVYGHTAATAAAADALGGGGEGGDGEAPEPIAYTLRTCPPSVNTRWTHCERYTYRGGSRRRGPWLPSGLTMRGERVEPRLRALRERDEDDVSDVDDPWYDEEEEDEGGTPIGEMARSPEQPTMGDWLAHASYACSSDDVVSEGWSEEEVSEAAWSEAWSELTAEEWEWLMADVP